MRKTETFLLAGNWKMNGGLGSRAEIEAIAAGAAKAPPAFELLLCPPFLLLEQAVQLAQGGKLHIGAQDCHEATSGAFTGDISAAMLAEIGVGYVLCGHSERRAAYGESNQRVQAKAEAALATNLHPIICVGETAEQYEQGKTLDVLKEQVLGSIPVADSTGANFTLAYEPIWAIGTGKAASPEDVARVHQFIATLTDAPILYGGSVKPDNAAELAAIDKVNGFLVGSASLKAQSFLAIMDECLTSS